MALFYFSHFIQAWILPPGLNLILILCGVALWRKARLFSQFLLYFAIVSLWLLSTPWVAGVLIDRIQHQYPVLTTTALSNQNNKSAIVVLGGGLGKAREYHHEHGVSQDTLSRLQYAAYLYDTTHLPVIVSGSKLEAVAMQTVLQEHFKIPVHWQENQSRNTADEAKFILPILKEHGINNIYLITHAWHMPRSMFVFNKMLLKEGIKVISAPTRFVGQNEDVLFDFIPSLSALNTSTIALHEYIGLFWYGLG